MPIFGKYIYKLGAQRLFIWGLFLAGVTNIAFGYLMYVNGAKLFWSLSLLIRILSAIGESALFAAVYPLATKVSDLTAVVVKGWFKFLLL